MITIGRTFISPASANRLLSLGSRTTSRYAHAARAQPEEEDRSNEAGPSTQRSHMRRRPMKDRDDQPDYRFPERSRRGGPPDPYEVLALERNASESQIKQQYYRLAMILHPDSSHPSSSPSHFATLHRAFKLLSQSQSRSAYLQTGFGWSPTGEVVRENWADAQMRSEIYARRRGGAAQWSAGSRGYRSSEAGGGAWSYPQEEQWQYGSEFATPPKGKGEELYMSNKKFISLFGAVGLLFAWVQYHRIGMAAETYRETLQQQHQGASYALAEARDNAVRFGKARREQLRRRVREIEVMNELEKMEAPKDVPDQTSGKTP